MSGAEIPIACRAHPICRACHRHPPRLQPRYACNSLACTHAITAQAELGNTTFRRRLNVEESGTEMLLVAKQRFAMCRRDCYVSHVVPKYTMLSIATQAATVPIHARNGLVVPRWLPWGGLRRHRLGCMTEMRRHVARHGTDTSFTLIGLHALELSQDPRETYYIRRLL